MANKNMQQRFLGVLNYIVDCYKDLVKGSVPYNRLKNKPTEIIPCSSCSNNKAKN